MKTGNQHGQHWLADKRRLAIYLRDGMACVYCLRGVEGGIQLTLDHVTPRSRGGSNKNSNLLTACMGCNVSRGQVPFSKWCVSVDKIPMVLRRQARRPLDEAATLALIARRGGFRAAVYGVPSC